MNNNIIKSLKQLASEIEMNDKVTFKSFEVKPGYSPDELKEMEEGLEVKYSGGLKSFYSEIGEVKLSWYINLDQFWDVIPENDHHYLWGGIRILNPFDMIMGMGGARWKDELWFDNMDSEKREMRKTLAPFDFPSPNLISGFRKHGNIVSEEMFILDIIFGLQNFPLQLETYLELAIKTKGLAYWPRFFNAPSSEDYQRMLTYMPILFDDFKESDF